MAASRLRITGGTARGIPLAEPRGHRLRPATGLVREAVFNILGDTVEGTRVLDLFAGTGAYGVEALSRGASHATFIEAHPAACKAILDSLSRTGFQEKGLVLRGRLPAALTSAIGPFDIVFMDPPYDDKDAPELLASLRPLLTGGAQVVYEHGSRYNPPEQPAGLTLDDRRVYGDSAIALYTAMEVE
jgi:16S rRNA (guanine966-N2)-methyltransferase